MTHQPGTLIALILLTTILGCTTHPKAETPRPDASAEPAAAEIELDVLDDPPVEEEFRAFALEPAAPTDIPLSFPSAEAAPLGETMAAFARPRYPEIRTPGLQVYVFDIGQADSALFVGPPPGHRSMLVDIGEERGCQGNYKTVARRVEEDPRAYPS